MVNGWDDSTATGNELIDRQHREVVRLLDELRASHLSSEERARKALADLMDFTATHFMAEERLMHEVGLAEWIRDHEAGVQEG